jgi:hypothetical protein
MGVPKITHGSPIPGRILGSQSGSVGDESLILNYQRDAIVVDPSALIRKDSGIDQAILFRIH